MTDNGPMVVQHLLDYVHYHPTLTPDSLCRVHLGDNIYLPFHIMYVDTGDKIVLSPTAHVTAAIDTVRDMLSVLEEQSPNSPVVIGLISNLNWPFDIHLPIALSGRATLIISPQNEE